MPLSDLAPVLAQSRRARTGTATAAGKQAAATIRAAHKRVSTSDALRKAEAQAELERTRRFTSLFSAIGKRDHARAALDNPLIPEGSPEYLAAQSAWDAYAREVSDGFALPIIPSDIRAGGRFARKAREQIVRNARQHTVGSLLLTSAAADDLVAEAVHLCYSRGDVTSVPAADYGWRSLDGMRGNRVQQRSNWTATVPTLGGMYRAIRAAYALELSAARREVRTFSLDESWDVLAERPASRSVAPLTDAERAPRRRATPTEQRDAYAENMGDTTRAEATERINAFLRRDERMAAARASFAFGLDSESQRDADVDKTCVALIAEGESLDAIAAYMGITRATLVRRLSSVRIAPAEVAGNRVTAFRRIAPDERARRRTPRVVVNSDVIVTRAERADKARRVPVITSENVTSESFAMSDERRSEVVSRFAGMHLHTAEEDNRELSAERLARLDAQAALVVFA